jgi:hypothetical protein
MKQANGYEMILLLEKASYVYIWANGLGYVKVDGNNLACRIYSQIGFLKFEYQGSVNDSILYINTL